MPVFLPPSDMPVILFPVSGYWIHWNVRLFQLIVILCRDDNSKDVRTLKVYEIVLF